MVIKGSSKTKDRAGAGNEGNRTVACLDNASGLIVNSFCFNIIIVPRAILLGEDILPNRLLQLGIFNLG
jgi:hypothetical protein